MVCLVVVLASATAATAFWGRYLAQVGPLEAPATVVIKGGMGTRRMAEELKEANVIGSTEAFVLAVHALRLDGTLKAGDYDFDAGISLRAVVNKLALGDTKNHSVTIPEGWTARQIVARLDEANDLDGRLSRPAEGEVFPDTYAYRFGTERDKLLDSMKERMQEELQKAWDTRDTTAPLKNPGELLILASIVQKEAASNEEMPKVAAVFVNRLRLGMKLQSDPTVAYGAEESGRLLHKDLTEPHPFNTYIYPGLPPTPISSPGKAALMAAAHPADIKALFFVADPSRTMHVFSETYAEHERAVKRYWDLVGKVSHVAAVSASVVSPTIPVTVSVSTVAVSASSNLKKDVKNGR